MFTRLSLLAGMTWTVACATTPGSLQLLPEPTFVAPAPAEAAPAPAPIEAASELASAWRPADLAAPTEPRDVTAASPVAVLGSPTTASPRPADAALPPSSIAPEASPAVRAPADARLMGATLAITGVIAARAARAGVEPVDREASAGAEEITDADRASRPAIRTAPLPARADAAGGDGGAPLWSTQALLSAIAPSTHEGPHV